MNKQGHLLRGGRVIDPANERNGIFDLRIEDGRIAEIGTSLAPKTGDVVLDVRGKYVVPGLVDLHCHVFRGMSSYGVDPDRAGWRSGVTHVNEMGSTGPLTFSGFRELVSKAATTPISAFPNLLAMGLPENFALGMPQIAEHFLRADLFMALVEHNRGMVRGIKIHADRGLCSIAGEHFPQLTAAREVVDATGINLYVHLGDLWPIDPLGPQEDPKTLALRVVEKMRPGEILGHCFTQHPGGLVNENGAVSEAATLATEMGVLHEIGHGLNFSFMRARAFMEAGLLPDIISSDIHGTVMHAGRALPHYGVESDDSAEGCSWSMVGSMSKMLAIGMPLMEVIRASTITPATALRIDDQKGTLGIGRRADITVLDSMTGDYVLEDSVGVRVEADYVLIPTQVFLAGRPYELHALELPEFVAELLVPRESVAHGS